MTLRLWLRVVAAFVLMCGLVSLPSPGANPKRLASLFFSLADSGSMLHLGLIFIGVSIVLFVVSFIDRSHE